MGCVQKIVRTWSIREFVCNNQRQREFQQFIEIVDTVGPSMKVAADMKVTTNLTTCARNMLIPGLDSLYDACMSNPAPTKVIVNVRNGQYVGSISTDAGTFSIINGGFLEIPFGSDTVIYQAFDACHNVSMDTMIITVEDHTAPVVICKEFLVIGLASDGVVKLPASSVDNGTFDDCGLGAFCVARMVDLLRFDSLQANGVGNVQSDGSWYVPLDSMVGVCNRIFTKSGTNDSGMDFIIRDDLCTPYIEYCCSDAGIMDTVIFQAKDKSNNVNQCMVVVQVQDKRVPSVHCPPDLTIDCQFSFATDSVFGLVVAQGQQQALTIPANQVLGIQSGKNLTDGVWFGNCAAQVSVNTVNNRDQCGAGTIQRTFTVAANGFSTTCTQTITFSRENVLKPSNVVFPANVTMNGCSNPNSVPPDSTGSPSVLEPACTLIGNAYQDLVVRFNNNSGDACFKIIREWTVIDWCKTPSFTIATGTQEIKINDAVAPVINNGVECQDTVINVSDCNSATISLTQSGFDLCTAPENLLWTVHVDLDNDGDFDDTQNLIGNIQGSNSVAVLTASYHVGSHRVVWELRDQCGNVYSCEQMFSILNANPPNAICRTSLTGPLTPVDDGSSQNGQPLDSVANDAIADGGELTVWASEYDSGSSTHPCHTIVYSFDNDTIVPSRTLTCADYNPVNLGDSVTLNYQVFVLAVVINTVNGQPDTTILSSSICNVNFILYDQQNTCNDSINDPATLILISGNIHTAHGDNLPTIGVDLLGTNSTASTLATKTNNDGMYAFPSMSTGGSYSIAPSLDKDILNGVSTLDLVLIQKHILGLDRFQSPYKIIAGDANNDKIISAIDLIELRKVILAVTEEFTNNESWRFVEDNYVFEDKLHPLQEAFTTSHDIKELERNMVVDFTGIKVGDVNSSVNVSGLITNPRFYAQIQVEDRSFVPGQIVSVPISLSGIDDILGYQFDLSFDELVLNFTGFRPGKLPITSVNFGTTRLDQGTLSSSWNTSEGVLVNDNVVFTLEFEARRSGRLSDVLAIDRNRIQSEVYTQNIERANLSLDFLTTDIIGSDGYYLLQNTPNPFSDLTTIGFVLPTDETVELRIHDVSGQLITKYTGKFFKGENFIDVKRVNLGASTGVLVYTLETDSYSSTKEMILVD